MSYRTYYIHTSDINGKEKTITINASSYKEAKTKIKKSYPDLMIIGIEKSMLKTQKLSNSEKRIIGKC